MKHLSINEITNVTGGNIGDVEQYTFALFPGEKMVGVQLTVVGYEKKEIIEKGFFYDTIYKVWSPIYDAEPIVQNAYPF